MAVGTRKSPSKDVEIPESRRYFQWTTTQRTWMAEWIRDNVEVWKDTKLSKTKKYQMIFADMPDDENFPKANCNANTIKNGWEKMEAQYKNWAARISSTGEGLQEDEVSARQANLWRNYPTR